MPDNHGKEEQKERAILVGLNCGNLPDFDNSDEETMDELAELLETAGGVAEFRAMQTRANPDPGSFIGEGKCEELRQIIQNEHLDLAIFDNELTPSQNRVLEEALGCRVIDRNALILDIFADRAKTAEGKLQVELAQYQYILPRLTGMWGHLVRQTAAGGSSPIGTRGPGETQLETDRRHIRRRIQRLEKEIDEVRKIRATQRKKRVDNHVPLVCLVGYTNAGKSTLLNALTGAGVHANDRLFDTLDPTVKSYRLPEGDEIILSDTVGFIRKLPHHLVDAFRATLEELSFADVLVHVIDASDPQWRMQAEVVDKLIAQLGAENTPRITVFNKVDRLTEDMLPRETGAVYCSAKRGMGLEKLVGRVAEILGAGMKKLTFVIPYSDGSVLDMLHRDARVRGEEYLAEGIRVTAELSPKVIGRLKAYLPESEWKKDEEF